MKYLIALFTLTLFIACQEPVQMQVAAPEPQPHAAPLHTQQTRVEKTDEEWKAQLSDMEYHVTREAGTERAFSGKYWDHHEHGTYNCVCCHNPLFHSDTKFKSGTGWPSFYEPTQEGNVGEKQDLKYGMVRTEVICKICDAHLGHVFKDGPQPTGLRYCINSASLHFQEDQESSEPEH